MEDLPIFQDPRTPCHPVVPELRHPAHRITVPWLSYKSPMHHTRMLTWLLRLLLLGHVASASYRGAGDAQGRTRGRFLQQMNVDTAPANKNDVVSTDSPVSPNAPTPVPSPVPMQGGDISSRSTYPNCSRSSTVCLCRRGWRNNSIVDQYTEDSSGQ
jgi:hypothetical protein